MNEFIIFVLENIARVLAMFLLPTSREEFENEPQRDVEYIGCDDLPEFLR